MLYNFHYAASFDRSRSHAKRLFHRSQARIIRKKLKALQNEPYDWQKHCQKHLDTLKKPSLPLT